MIYEHLIYCSFTLLILKTSFSTATYSCRDENDEIVDWFVIYKLPRLIRHPNPLVDSGVAYAYIPSTNNGNWILSNKSINSVDSIPGNTLKNFYSKNNIQDLLYVLYNDQPPVGNETSSGGHTKGVVVTDQSGGFWMVHSVPHYPPPPPNYSYPSTGHTYGQSFLCITLNSQQMELVGTQLMYNYPHIFANATPEALMKQYPILSKAAKGADINKPPWNNEQSLVSLQGTNFTTFAKAPEFNKDLYSDWLVTVLRVDLMVETWSHSQERLNSSCHRPFRVENIDLIAFLGTSFSSFKDHSKWAISESENEPWVCIGDINRVKSQTKRGGGTVCLKDLSLWKAYYKAVIGVEGCPNPKCWTQLRDPHNV